MARTGATVILTKEILSYKVQLRSVDFFHRYKITLNLGAGYFANLQFAKLGADETSPAVITGGKTFVAYFKHEDFLNVLDVLRNESPLFFRYHPEKQRAWISSEEEDIGEDDAD